MAWTTIQDTADGIDDAIATFEGGSGVSSIDAFSVTRLGSNRVVALVQYTEA